MHPCHRCRWTCVDAFKTAYVWIEQCSYIHIYECSLTYVHICMYDPRTFSLKMKIENIYTHTHSHPHHEMAKKLAHTWSEHTSKKDRTNPIIARWFIVLKREQQQYYASNIFELEMINVRIVPDFLWDKLNERSGRLQELPTMAVRYPQFCNCIFIIRYGPAPIVFYQTSASHGMALRAAKKA